VIDESPDLVDDDERVALFGVRDDDGTTPNAGTASGIESAWNPSARYRRKAASARRRETRRVGAGLRTIRDIGEAAPMSTATEDHVVDAVAEPQAARLEFRQRAVTGSGRETVRGIRELRLGCESGQNLVRVRLPIRRHMKVAAGANRHTSSATKAGRSNRRLWWRFLGQGSGKNT